MINENLYYISYDKEENLKINDPKLLHFTHLLVEQKGKYFYENEDLQRTHEVLDTINCFSNIGVEYRSVFPIKIKTRPCIIILRRKAGVVPPRIEPPVQVVNIESSKSAETAEEELLNENQVKKDESDDSVDDDGYEDDDNSEDTGYVENEDESENIEDDEDIEGIEGVEDTEDLEDPENTEDPFELENNAINEDEQLIVETELKRPTKETKHKLKKFIERHYRLKALKAPPNDRTDIVPATPSRPSIKSNIRHIIKKEKIKELIERISQIDLRTVCDLENESTKQCLLKIIDSYIE